MLKRYQILLTEWLADHLKAISEKYDISMSEAVRLVLSLQIPKLISIAYPKYKTAISDKKLVTTIRKARNNQIYTEDLHKLFSNIYFEGRKAIELWEKEEKKRKSNRT